MFKEVPTEKIALQWLFDVCDVEFDFSALQRIQLPTPSHPQFCAFNFSKLKLGVILLQLDIHRFHGPEEDHASLHGLAR